MASDFIEYKLGKKKKTHLHIFGTNFQAIMGLRILSKTMILYLLWHSKSVARRNDVATTATCLVFLFPW